jgi:hypothetical protein
VIDNPGWYERKCGELRICDEYLQQCQQTDLLPDQRWVQLISLHRHGLEMEPRWRDALSARNIVAPGAAAIDLGLRVAQESHLVTLRPDQTSGSHGGPDLRPSKVPFEGADERVRAGWVHEQEG